MSEPNPNLTLELLPPERANGDRTGQTQSNPNVNHEGNDTPDVIGNHVEQVHFEPNLPVRTATEESLSQIRLGTPAPRRSKTVEELSESPQIQNHVLEHFHSSNPNHVHFTPDTSLNSPAPEQQRMSGRLKAEGATIAARLYYEKQKEQDDQLRLETENNTQSNVTCSGNSSTSSALPPLPPHASSNSSSSSSSSSNACSSASSGTGNVRFTADTEEHCRTDESLSQLRQGTPLPPSQHQQQQQQLGLGDGQAYKPTSTHISTPYPGHGPAGASVSSSSSSATAAAAACLGVTSPGLNLDGVDSPVVVVSLDSLSVNTSTVPVPNPAPVPVPVPVAAAAGVSSGLPIQPHSPQHA